MVVVQPTGRVDLAVPEREIGTGPVPRGMILVEPAVAVADLLVRDPGGGWRMHPDLFWSLVRPCHAAAPEPEQMVDTAWQGLALWRALEVAELEACRLLIERQARGAAEVIDILVRVAKPGPPAGHRPLAEVVRRPDPVPLPTLADLGGFMTDASGFGRAYGDSFTPRHEQAELAVTIGRALQDGEALVAEAGTGTGKTLAYLVPLLARLAGEECRAVISTYSRALQHQILAGDLPRVIGSHADIDARLLMGRSNYLCLRQRTSYLTRPLENAREALKTLALRVWLQATADGLREELARHPLLAEDLRLLFSSLQPCTPRCHVDDRCFVARARKLARQADLVVVNHALLLHDHAAGNALLGPYDHVIVDEAQRLPAAALDARSVGLHLGRWRDLEALLGGSRAAGETPEVAALLVRRLDALDLDPSVVAAAAAFGKATGRALRQFRAWWRRAGTELAPTLSAGSGPRQRVADKDVAFGPWRDETLTLLAALSEAAATAARLNQRTESLGDLPDDVVDLLVRAAQSQQEWARLERDVRFVTSDPSDRWVTWAEPSVRGGLATLGATPLESGPLLRELWQDGGLSPVATSATLAVGGDFGFMLDELGLSGRHPRARTFAVPSPFLWHERAICLAPERFPDPDAPAFLEAVTSVLADLREQVPRQTLVLFTSYRQLQDVSERLADRPTITGGPLLAQTPGGGVDGLRERFRSSRGAMLLGTSTFWEGVDFPGDSLEVVVVVKLPFLVPSDPWVEARCEHLQRAGENAFSRFMLRDAVLRLRQGVGRLLRRQTDRGVILLLDNRLITRQYGATFRDALPTAVRWAGDRRELAGQARTFLDEA